MKLYLYMAATANGYISNSQNKKMISSASGWKRYCRTVKSFGNVILGSKTFGIMEKYHRIGALGKVKVIILTKRRAEPGKYIQANSPKEALMILKEMGFKRALLAGGAHTNLSFLKDDLIDEIYLDVEPKIFGSGIGIFRSSRIDRKLKLLGAKLHRDGVVQLHYRLEGPAS